MSHVPASPADKAATGGPARFRFDRPAWLVVLALLSPVGLVLFLPVHAWVVSTFVPYHSASIRVEELGITVRLRFYLVWNHTTESGRYLTIDAPSGRITITICGYDWAHRPRTSLYLTGDRKLAVFGPDACDYLVATEPVRIVHPFKAASDDWIYLGAFDISTSNAPVVRRLRFVPAAEQEECLYPQGSVERLGVEWNRNGARRPECPPPPAWND